MVPGTVLVGHCRLPRVRQIPTGLLRYTPSRHTAEHHVYRVMRTCHREAVVLFRVDFGQRQHVLVHRDVASGQA